MNIRRSDARLLRYVVSWGGEGKEVVYARNAARTVARLLQRGLVEDAGPYAVRITNKGREALARHVKTRGEP